MEYKTTEKKRERNKAHYHANKLLYRGYWNSERHKETKRRLYATNDITREATKLRSRRRAAALRAYFNLVKEASPCFDCGNKFPAIVMDYDHLPHFQKNKCVSVLIAERRSMKLILDEIAKCDLVCANCHRLRTKNRGATSASA